MFLSQWVSRIGVQHEGPRASRLMADGAAQCLPDVVHYWDEEEEEEEEEGEAGGDPQQTELMEL